MPGVRRVTRYLTLFAFGLIIVQGLLGAVTVWQELPASIERLFGLLRIESISIESELIGHSRNCAA